MFKPGDRISRQEQVLSRGMTLKKFEELQAMSVFIPAYDEVGSLQRADQSRPDLGAPASIEGDPNDTREDFVQDPNDLRTHLNNPNEKKGYDPKMLANKDDQELLSLCLRVIPGLNKKQQASLVKDRAKMVDTLTENHRQSSASKASKSLPESAEDELAS